MKVVSFETQTKRRAYRARREVQAGETCYAVQDEATKLYFAWSYTNEAFARLMCGRLIIESDTDRAFNWRRNIQDTTVSSRDAI